MEITKRKPGALPSAKRSAPPSFKRNDSEDCGLWHKILKNSLWGGLSSIISSLVLVTFFCMIAYSNPNPNAFIFPCALACTLISAFIGGFVCAVKTRENPLMCGLTCGSVILIFMLLTALCLTNTPSSSYSLLIGAILHIIAVIFTILGALTGNATVNARTSKKRFGR